MATHVSKMARREAFEGYLFILPWILGYILFRFGPLLASLYLSLTNYDGSGLPKFVGFENYQYLFTQDPRIINSIRATFQFVGGFLPLSLVIGLTIAIFNESKGARHSDLPRHLLPACGHHGCGGFSTVAVCLQ